MDCAAKEGAGGGNGSAARSYSGHGRGAPGAQEVLAEAQAVFANTVVANDLDSIKVGKDKAASLRSLRRQGQGLDGEARRRQRTAEGKQRKYEKGNGFDTETRRH